MRRNFTSTITIPFFVFSLYFNSSFSQVPVLEFQPVLENQFDIVDIVHAGDGSNRIFVVRQSGNIQVFNQTFNYIGDFLLVSDLNTSGNERGLLSMAFHPDYENNGYVFVYYTGGPNGDITLARYKRMASDPNKADPNSRVIVLTIPKPIRINPPHVPDEIHNGGKLNFGPEGYLYFATGDGGGGYDVYGKAEDGNSLLGKMIRIDVNVENPPYYSIPPDNPYLNDPHVLDEIWAIGLRNPWRWSFDKLTHDIWLGDVGQRHREEVNYIPAGNPGGFSFGWHCYEGLIPTPTVPPCTSANYLPPIFDYPHDMTGGQSIIAGYVYRGTEFPNLVGYYICGDYTLRNAWLIRWNNNNSFWEIHRQRTLPSTIYSFGEAENGNLYITGNAGIYKVAVSAPLPAKLVSFTLLQGFNFNELKWKTASETNLNEFELQFSKDGIHFSEAARIPASGKPNGNSYLQKHFVANAEKTFYRLQMMDNDGSVTYSKIISTIKKSQTESLRVYPTISNGQRIQVELNQAFPSLLIYNIYGQLVHRVETGGGTGMVYLDVQSWKKGMYILIAKNDQGQENRTFTLQ